MPLVPLQSASGWPDGQTPSLILFIVFGIAVGGWIGHLVNKARDRRRPEVKGLLAVIKFAFELPWLAWVDIATIALVALLGGAMGLLFHFIVFGAGL